MDGELILFSAAGCIGTDVCAGCVLRWAKVSFLVGKVLKPVGFLIAD